MLRSYSEDVLSINLSYAPIPGPKVKEISVSEKSNKVESILGTGKILQKQTPLTPVDSCNVLLDKANEKIDLNFQNASLTNILRILSEISGFNIIIADEVKGNMNIKLHSVPWNQAFNIILDNNKLAIKCIGENIINVVPQADIDLEVARSSCRSSHSQKAGGLTKCCGSH